MKLKVLGSSSQGNCYILEDNNGEKLMLECGLSYSEIKKRSGYDLSNMSGVVVSHYHGDHAKSATEMLIKGYKLFISEGTANVLFENNFKDCGLRVNIVESEKTYRLGTYSVMPFSVDHDAADTMGFLIHHPEMGVMCFVTDTAHIRFNLQNINHWLIEANYSSAMLQEQIDGGVIEYKNVKRAVSNHMSLETATEVVRIHGMKGVKNVVLIHMSDRNSYEDHFKTYFSERTGMMPYLADKGMEIIL